MPDTRGIRADVPSTDPSLVVHHHAYFWSGLAWPPRHARWNRGQATPPVKLHHWLYKPLEMHKEHLVSPERCARWVLECFAEHRPGAWNYDEKTWVQSCLRRALAGESFERSYETVDGLFVALAVVACPQRGIRCPLEPK